MSIQIDHPKDLTGSGTGDAVLHWVLDECRPKGWAIEFGTHSGRTTRRIAESMPVISLDSFAGLPEDWREGFPKGAFRRDMLNALPSTYFQTMLIKGWYVDTVPALVARGLPPLGLVHIDCDLYSSTVTALEGVIDSIDVGTIVVFDEYHGYEGAEDHEEKAWQEFIVKYGVTAEQIARGDQSAAFVIHDIGHGDWMDGL